MKKLLIFLIIISVIGILFVIPNFPVLSMQKIISHDPIQLDFGYKVYNQIAFENSLGNLISEASAQNILITDGNTEAVILDLFDEELIWEKNHLVALRINEKSLQNKGLDVSKISFVFPSDVSVTLQRSNGGGPLMRVFNEIF